MTVKKMTLGAQTIRITYTPAMYMDYIIPLGFLRPDVACHALWHYYITAVDNFKKEFDTLYYEGDPDPTFNYKQLFTSIAQMYDVRPEEMEKYWANVDMQCVSLHLTKLPDASRYRFPSPKIVLQ